MARLWLSPGKKAHFWNTFCFTATESSAEEMIEHLWDGSVNSFSNSIRVHISSLRKKLRTALGYDPIQNKIGQGYIMED